VIADLFIKILNISIGAVPIMAALLILRLLFKKAVPRKVFYIAWALVFLRLMVPFSIESDLSFFNHVPKAEIVEGNIGTSVIFIENSGTTVDFPVLNHPGADNPNTDAPAADEPDTEPEKPSAPVVSVAKIDKNHIYGTIWIFGTAGLLLFGIVGYFAVLKKTRFESIPYTKNIRLSDYFKTPIVCGLFRPKIILPMNFDLDDEAKVNSVIAHECTHIRRGDNFWRLLASFTLYVHWFNPLVWLCYCAFIRDMEVSCDEEVLAKSKTDIRTEYAESLVSLSGSGINPLYGGVLSFGESGIKERVKCIMNFKKATVFILIICVMAAVALGVIFLTNPSAGEESEYYEITMEKSEALVFDKEKGVDISAKIRNISDIPIYIYPEIELYFYDENIWMFFGNYYPSEGTVVLNPGEEGVFCGTLGPELFEAVPEIPGKYKIKRQISKDSGNTELIDYEEYYFEIKENINLETAEDILSFVKENPDLLDLIENPSDSKSRDLKYYKNANPEIPDAVVEFFYLLNSAFVTLEVPDFSELDNGTGNFYMLEQYLKYEVARERIENGNDYATDFELEIEKQSEDSDKIVFSCLWNFEHKGGRSSGGRDFWEFRLDENGKIKSVEYVKNGKGGLYSGIENIFEDIKRRYAPGHENDYEIIVNIGIAELLKENGYFGNNSGESLIRNDLSGKIVSGNIAKKFIPSEDFPEYERLGEGTEAAEYYRNVLLNITSGAVKIRKGGITLNVQPNSKNYVVSLDEEKAGRLMSCIERINILTIGQMPNPNTGGMLEIYIETENGILKIAYDGRLVLSHRGAEYASVFDGIFITDVFEDIREIADEALSEAEAYSGNETNPAIGSDLYAAVYNGEVPEVSVLPSEIVWADAKQKEYCEKLIDDIDLDFTETFVVGDTSDGKIKTEISKNQANDLLNILKDTHLVANKPTNPNMPVGKTIDIITKSGDYIRIVWNTDYFTLYKKGEEAAYRFNGAGMVEFFEKFSNLCEKLLSAGKKTETEYIDVSGTESLIPDNIEPFATLFSNASKTAAISYIETELRDLLKYENFKSVINSEDAKASSLGNPLTEVDVIEFIKKDDGKKITLSLYEKGFVLSGSAVEKLNGAIIAVEENTWEYFVNKINSEFGTSDCKIPYWFGLISTKRVTEVVVFDGNGEKYRYTVEDDSFENFFSILKSDINVSSVKERFPGNKLPDPVSEKYIKIKIYFVTGTVYEIIAEENYITMVSSDMNYGLRYNLAVPANAYDAFLDYAEGGPINAVTG